jgi:hypothetical protein
MNVGIFIAGFQKQYRKVVPLRLWGVAIILVGAVPNMKQTLELLVPTMGAADTEVVVAVGRVII